MNFFVKNIFSEYEHIWITADLLTILNKSLTGNFIFCVVYITGFTAESCKFFFKPTCQPLVYFTSINTWHRLDREIRNRFLALAANNSTFTLAGAWLCLTVRLLFNWLVVFDSIGLLLDSLFQQNCTFIPFSTKISPLVFFCNTKIC